MMYYLYYALCIVLLGACAGNTKSKAATEATGEAKEKVKYVNSIKITSPQKNELHSYNGELAIVLEAKERFTTDSTQLFINGEKIATLPANTFTYNYRIPAKKVGNTIIKAISWHPGNKRGIATIAIQVKPDKAPQKYTYEVIRTLKHDPKAYTQGLVYKDGFIYEGTGQYGESTLRKTDMSNGTILSVLSIDSQMFGEGITIYKDKIYQITWRSRKGFVYDLKTFSLESTFSYNSEGWGITTLGNKLIMSDGSNKLYHIAPESFNIIKEVEVYDHNGPVDQLNELEYVDGVIWANVWLTNRIVAINPETGAVKGEIDMNKLLPAADQVKLDDKDDVLNGIAWNPEKKTFYLTGKRWPKMFEVKVNTTNLQP